MTTKQSEQFSGLKYILARQNLHFSPQNAPQKWYKRDGRKQRSRVRYWVVSYIISFFFNLAEKNLLIVEKFSKCRENGIACLQKGQLGRGDGVKSF